MRVTSPKIIKELLEKNGLNPLKKFGQNFLTDQNIVQKIAEAAAPENSNVIEIGLGLGALTDALCSRCGNVATIEIDKGLAALAKEIQGEHENLIIIEGDILKTDIDALADEYFDGEPFYVCGNLPYYITAPIIMKVLEEAQDAVSLTAMVQKEVAERLSAKPKDSDYGIITAIVDYFGGAELLFTVSKNCFYPVPKVDSALIKINIIKNEDVPFKYYARVVKAAFAMRRKTILNNLKSIFGENAQSVLESCRINPKLRAQDLFPEDYIMLAEYAQNIK